MCNLYLNRDIVHWRCEASRTVGPDSWMPSGSPTAAKEPNAKHVCTCVLLCNVVVIAATIVFFIIIISAILLFIYLFIINNNY